MKKMSLKNITMLFLTAFIWGVAFVAQSVGMNYIGPFTFSCVRSILGGIVLIPCIWFLDRLKMKEEGVTEKRTMSEKEKKTLLIGGICCGIALCVASNLQQFGVKYTTVGKAGFITALYIVLVPIFGIFLKKKVGVKVWISVSSGVYHQNQLPKDMSVYNNHDTSQHSGLSSLHRDLPHKQGNALRGCLW